MNNEGALKANRTHPLQNIKESIPLRSGLGLVFGIGLGLGLVLGLGLD
jgi:hypothetical protein